MAICASAVVVWWGHILGILFLSFLVCSYGCPARDHVENASSCFAVWAAVAVVIIVAIFLSVGSPLLVGFQLLLLLFVLVV